MKNKYFKWIYLLIIIKIISLLFLTNIFLKFSQKINQYSIIFINNQTSKLNIKLFNIKNELKKYIKNNTFRLNQYFIIILNQKNNLKLNFYNKEITPYNIINSNFTEFFTENKNTKKIITKILTYNKFKNYYYYKLPLINKSFKELMTKYNIPKNIQLNLLKNYNQIKKIKKNDTLEIFYKKNPNKLIKINKLLYINLKINNNNHTYYKYKKYFYNKNGKNIILSSNNFMTYPIPGAKLTSKYGMRKHPILKRWKMHNGIDFAAPHNTPIHASASGKILIANWYKYTGYYIQIDHQNNYKSGYMHMSSFSKNIKVGKYIKKGQIIGYVGKTGLATGNHLHFVVSKNGKKINPMTVIQINKFNQLSGESLNKFKNEKIRILTNLYKLKNNNLIYN